MRIDFLKLRRQTMPVVIAIGLVGISTTVVYAATSAHILGDSASTSNADFLSRANSDLVLVGPVEAVRDSDSSIQVLGQSIAISSKIHVSVGDFVEVYGLINVDGTFAATAIRQLDSAAYVAGATPVFIKGSISAIDYKNGQLKIGSCSINYNGALHTLAAEKLAKGSIAAFEGLSFASAPAFYADKGAVVALTGQTGSGRAESLGQTGSGHTTITVGQTGSGHTAATAGQTGSGRILRNEQSSSTVK